MIWSCREYYRLYKENTGKGQEMGNRAAVSYDIDINQLKNSVSESF